MCGSAAYIHIVNLFIPYNMRLAQFARQCLANWIPLPLTILFVFAIAKIIRIFNTHNGLEKTATPYPHE